MDRRPSPDTDADQLQPAKRQKLLFNTIERPSLILALRECHDDLEVLIQAPDPQLDAIIDTMNDANDIVEALVNKKILLEHRSDPVQEAEEEPSACHRTFATTELLEKILLQLRKPKKSKKYPLEPVVQLFVLQRVSRRFRDTIKGSELLQKKMTRPAAEDMEDFKDEHEIGDLIHYLAGPKISAAYQREEKARSWRDLFILHEDADPIGVHRYSCGQGRQTERDVDAWTTYSDLIGLDYEIQEEGSKYDDKEEAKLRKEYGLDYTPWSSEDEYVF